MDPTNYTEAVIRIVLIDDHNLFRAGIKALLATQLDLSVVAEADSAQAGLQTLQRFRCDLAVIDYNLPDRDGVWLMEKIQIQFPGLPVLVLSQFLEHGKVRRILEAGAFGYVVKSAEEEDLLAAIRVVGKKGLYVHPSVSQAALWSLQKPRDGLSERESSVLSMLGDGVANKEMATALHVSVGTVKRDLSNLFEKFSVSDRTQLLAEVIKQGLVGTESSGE